MKNCRMRFSRKRVDYLTKELDESIKDFYLDGCISSFDFGWGEFCLERNEELFEIHRSIYADNHLHKLLDIPGLLYAISCITVKGEFNLPGVANTLAETVVSGYRSMDETTTPVCISLEYYRTIPKGTVINTLIGPKDGCIVIVDDLSTLPEGTHVFDGKRITVV